MNLGLVFKSGDPVLIGVFLALLTMSIITWVLVVVRSVRHVQAKKANAAAARAIWASSDWAAAEQAAQKIDAPVSRLTLAAVNAKRSFQAAQSSLLSASLPQNAYLEREIRHSMGTIQSHFETGMTALATIGSTAPFVGLLGTVWGIYHALINIGNSGQISIAAVAQPIGEALVSTAVGLFVAIPAVLAYNFFTRGNKNLAHQLRDFAHDLHTQLVQGKE